MASNNPNAASSPPSRNYTPANNNNLLAVATTTDLVSHTYHIYPAAIDAHHATTAQRHMHLRPDLFPYKLHAMLINPDNAEIISWRPHGRAWNILDKERLGAVLLEQFGCDNVKKFLVSVNEWGFKVSRYSVADVCAAHVLENWNESFRVAPMPHRSERP
eukprot:scaffold134820_cov57-Cyclotella_meneghiniana.AAC.2